MANFASIFKIAAPFLTTAISFVPGGGPIANMAAAAISAVVGRTIPPSGIADAMTEMSGTEEGRLKLKQAEMDYSKTMTALGYDQVEKLEELAAGDRDSARKREMVVKDNMPKYLALTAVVTLMSCIFLLGFHTFPRSTEGAMLLLVGTLSGSYKDVYSYYFGSSSGSARKTEILNQIPPVAPVVTVIK